jgi:hypothetical protein
MVGMSLDQSYLQHTAAVRAMRVFLKPVHRGMILVEEKPDALLDAVRRYQPPSATKWIGRDER